MTDGAFPARGVAFGAVVSAPLWALIVWIGCKVVG